MGWKRVRDHYRIGHIVKIAEGNLHIGSPYIGDIIVVAPNGLIVKRDDRGSGDLGRYQQEIDADPALFARLFAAKDEFDDLMIVFTWEGGHIVQKLCETPGWPNLTIDGDLMHDNRYSTDRTQVVQWARASNEARIEGMRETVMRLEKATMEAQALLHDMLADKTLLDAERPAPAEPALVTHTET